MKAYYEDSSITIYNSDVLEALRQIPDESVNTCVTSPPYYGLRDYGTAEWEGGSADCDHLGRSQTSGASTLGKWKSGGGQRYKEETGGMPFTHTCGKCGARRVDHQIGLEKTPAEYIAKMVEVFREVRRVLRGDGTLWINIGDSYANDGKWGGETGGKQAYLGEENRKRVGREKRNTGLKPKDLVGIPWMLAFALRADGWYLRQDIIWHKPNPMPESVTDRCTKAHEYIFLLSKSERYHYDQEAILEECLLPEQIKWAGNENGLHSGEAHVGSRTKRFRTAGNKTHKTVEAYENADNEMQRTAAGLLKIADTEYPKRNKRSVWTVASQPFPEAHFATYPPDLIKPCILAGCPAGGTVLDNFAGSLTTMEVARDLNCKSIGIELNPSYIDIGLRCRLQQHVLPFGLTSNEQEGLPLKSG